jgi:hypothetical protein
MGGLVPPIGFFSILKCAAAQRWIADQTWSALVGFASAKRLLRSMILRG